jgi:iron(III) transport system ATP-binding protein
VSAVAAERGRAVNIFEVDGQTPMASTTTPTTTTAAISCRGLGKRFGAVRAVDAFDLDAEAGRITALLGPSGCGKTTTLRLIAGFERPDAGTIRLGERMLSGEREFVAPERRRIGIVFQDYALFPHYDVEGNVAYALPNGSDQVRVRELLELVGLEAIADRHPHELSGGQQQRVALARALAARPSAILLDEPFSNLDATLRDRMRRELRRILLAAGVTSIFVTHDQEEALSIADSVVVMRDGRVEQVGTPEEVYGRPTSRWVAEFLGEADALPAVASGRSVECELGRVAVNANFEGPAEVIIRPESIAVGSGPAPRGSEAHEAVVIERDFYGHDQLLQLELTSGQRVRSRRAGFPAWHPGDHVRVWIEGPVTALPARRDQ